MAVQCQRCDQPVIGEPKGYLTYYDPEEGPPERWTLLQCNQAGHPILVIQCKYYHEMAFEDDDPARVYPPQDTALSPTIPNELRDLHADARRAFHGKAYAPAVAACGRTLEAACTLQGINERRLIDSLQKMKDLGIIEERLWQWADLLRDIRNTAAHGDKKALAADPISRTDAEDCLALSEALLDYIYVLKARFDAMKERRSAPPEELEEI
jgi:hypothetical protein